MQLGAVVMLGAAGHTPQETLVLEAQRAASIDLCKLIQAHVPAQLILSSPELTWFPGDMNANLVLDPADEPFHFGQRLAALVQNAGLETLMYFGGGSAPLVDDQLMAMLVGLLVNSGDTGRARIPSHIALANNRHSSDWVCISNVQDALAIIQANRRDNSLAWALQESGLFDVRIPAGLRPATSMDLDTPVDLAIIRQHPECPAHLRAALQTPALDAIPLRETLQVLHTEGAHIALIGRVSPLAWQALSKATQCWLRVYSEERGMVAAERLARGEVKSLLGDLLRVQGTAAFFDTLAGMVDAAIIDSRVMMAAYQGELPSRADRFAADLFQIDAIEDDWLRGFTQAAYDAPIPIVMGGHNLVSGGLYALSEIIERG
ncbi:MAG: hypothetical protein ACLFTK_06800 [Anaerolineales bacterium]